MAIAESIQVRPDLIRPCACMGKLLTDPYKGDDYTPAAVIEHRSHTFRRMGFIFLTGSRMYEEEQ